MNVGLHETPNEGQTDDNMTDNSEAIQESQSDNVCNEFSQEDTPLFSCPDQCCTKVYTKVHFLERHLSLGNHSYSKNENQYDTVKQIWADQCIAVEREHKVLIKATAPSTTLTTRHEGWALKSTKSTKRFTTNVKDYILSIYQYFETTGKRPNYENIAEELKTKKRDDGSKVFIQEEWLSPSQIRSLFSNFVGKNTAKPFIVLTMPDKETQNDEALQQAIADIDTLEYHADMVNIALTTEVDLS
jgi:hypothetical protein